MSLLRGVGVLAGAQPSVKRPASRRLWLAGAGLALSAVLAPATFALTFSSSCDRFEIDGNAFGPADGTLDLVDEFDGGTLAPNWAPLLGSVEETAGALVAHNPGTIVPLGPIVFEISTVENAVHEIENGAGNFTMTSTWSPTLPATNAEFHMQLYSLSPIIEAAGLTVNNLSSQIAAQQGNGSLAGYSVSQSLTRGVGPGFSTVQFDTVAITPPSVTGPIVLRMSFNDATDMLTTSFSLDGGATFQSPFPPMHVFNMGVIDYDVLLGAAALNPGSVTTSTQTLPLQLLLVKSGASAASRRVTYKAKLPPRTGLIFGEPVIGGATFHLKLDAMSQCFSMPASGWTRNAQTYKYNDRAGLYGPVKAAWLKQTGNGLVNKLIIDGKRGSIDIVPPNPGARGDANFHVGNGGEYCASTAAGTIRPNDARTFKARNAPAPPDCTVPVCSASGAFLD